MTSKLFLHCGPAKTGTSAIQAQLRDAPPAGVFYPETGQWPDGAHHKLVFSLQKISNRGAIEIPPWDHLRPPLIAEIDRAMADGLDVVISSEGLTPVLAQQLLDQLLPGLRQSFDAVTAVVVLRHPLERAASAYNQIIKDAVTTDLRMPNVYLRETGPQFALTGDIRRWQQNPLAVEFLSYHPSGDLVDRFLALTGRDAPSRDDGAAPRKNTSMNGYALAALLCARRAGYDTAQRDALFDRLRADTDHPLWSGPSFPFSANVVPWYLDKVVAPDLEEVKRLTGIEIPRITATDSPPFMLDTAQANAIRSHFRDANLEPAQRKRIDIVLEMFAAPQMTAAPSAV